MNKFGMVLGVAAVVTLAGCKDPDYVHQGGEVQNEVKPAAPQEVQPAVNPDFRHTEPIAVETQPVKNEIVVDVSGPAKPLPPPEPEYTVYIVQRGDYLSKIAQKFNIKMDAIRRLNPKIGKGDVIYIGMKLKLPGKVDVGEQKAPAAAKPARAARAYAPYSGATKEYVVKNGDTLGAIAVTSGISIRQLKELNGLSKDSLRIGQKLKVPAAKVVAAAKPAKPAEKKPVAKKEAAKPAVAKAAAPVIETAPVAVPAPVTEAAPAADAAAPAAEAAPAADAAAAPQAEESAPATFNYVVQEGDDIPGVAIRWGVSTADVRELNKLGEGDQLVAGQVIKLPAEAQQ